MLMSSRLYLVPDFRVRSPVQENLDGLEMVLKGSPVECGGPTLTHSYKYTRIVK